MTTQNLQNTPPCSRLHQALQEVEAIIGEQHITRMDIGSSDSIQASRNVSLFRPRDIRAVVRPGTIAEVQSIVRIFDRLKPGVGLHAISTGRNWGLGSAEPATDAVVTVDLRRIATTRQINLSTGWAVVEPGVTQLALANAVAGTARMLNVTASSGHTSIIGNALERGVGLRRQRTEDLLGLEVILPDGELLRVGWWPDQERTTAINPHGLGPSLLHLFTQSNFGIVTAAVIKLLPRPEAQRVLRLTFPRAVLDQAIDTLRRWVAQDLVSGVLKVYDTVSTETYGGTPEQHLVLLCISGTIERVDALTQIVLSEAEKSAIFSHFSRSDQMPANADDYVLQVVEHAYAGSPAHNEHMLKSATGAHADEVDSAGGGWIFFLAFVPFEGHSVARALRLIDLIHDRCGIRPGTTVNALSSDVIDLVVSIKFDATPEATSRAHAALDYAYEVFSPSGFLPYRLDIDHSHWRPQFAPDASAHRLSQRIRKVIDPNSVIAPGRYA